MTSSTPPSRSGPASPHVIAIDGGAASGKSSTARELARRRNLLHVDTGSHYRALTAALIREGVSSRADQAELAAALDRIELGARVDGCRVQITLAGEIPPESELRGDEVNARVSAYSALPAVREKLLRYQRSLAGLLGQHPVEGLVMEGRDIGTVVFPDAPLKIFLEAEASTRQERRIREGQSDSIARRDQADSSRATAPLAAAPDAIRIDTGLHNLEEVVARIEQWMEQRTTSGH